MKEENKSSLREAIMGYVREYTEANPDKTISKEEVLNYIAHEMKTTETSKSIKPIQLWCK